jgi:hypothetical protein
MDANGSIDALRAATGTFSPNLSSDYIALETMFA